MTGPDDAAKALAEFYDRTDTSTEIADATWEPDVVADPMVTTSLRLPKSLLDQVRDAAARERTKPTALIRRLVEAGIRLRTATHAGKAEESGSTAAGRPDLDPGAAELAALVSRAAVDDARRAAQDLVERVRREVVTMHRTAVADAALRAFPQGSDPRGHDAVLTAAQAATEILEAAEEEAARIRADAEREVAMLTARRDAITVQLRNVREMLAALTGGIASLEERDPDRLRAG